MDQQIIPDNQTGWDALVKRALRGSVVERQKPQKKEHGNLNHNFCLTDCYIDRQRV